jgi:shikimate kinase
MNNTIIYLIGFPGVGKLTIAKELCNETSALLVDHHTLSNPRLLFLYKSINN